MNLIFFAYFCMYMMCVIIVLLFKKNSISINTVIICNNLIVIDIGLIRLSNFKIVKGRH